MPAKAEPKHERMGIERVAHSRVGEVDLATVGFGTVFSDHMFSAEFRDGQWSSGKIRPYGPLLLEPSIGALHYGVSVFEGLKAHRAPNGTPLLFRAQENARRLHRSAATISHIGRIRYQDRTIALPPVEKRTIAPAVLQKLAGVMTKRQDDPYSWVERVPCA
jgi:hypothetical protein